MQGVDHSDWSKTERKGSNRNTAVRQNIIAHIVFPPPFSFLTCYVSLWGGFDSHFFKHKLRNKKKKEAWACKCIGWMKFSPSNSDRKSIKVLNSEILLLFFFFLEDMGLQRAGGGMQICTQQATAHLYWNSSPPSTVALFPCSFSLLFFSSSSYTHTHTLPACLCVSHRHTHIHTPSFVWSQTALKADPVALLRRMLICPHWSLWGRREWTLAANALSH